MPWQRSGFTGPRTVQTVRDSACLRSLKSKHTVQMKAEIPFHFGRSEEEPPPPLSPPPPPLPAHTDCEVLLCGALQQEPSSPLVRRNPTILQGPPCDAPRSVSLHRSHTHQGLTPAHTSQMQCSQNHHSPHTPTNPRTHAQTLRHSALPGLTHLGRPRAAHFALGQPNFIAHCIHTQVP